MTKELKYVLDTIKEHELFTKHDFRLVGGTALSFHINHRLSEDLDFFILNALPRDDIDSFIEFCIEKFGMDKVKTMPLSDSAIYDFEKNAEDIYDYQQDWSIAGVKVTFADCSENLGLSEFLSTDEYAKYGEVKITSVATIFKMKSLMFYKRTKSRDYFDILTLYKNGFTPNDTLSIIEIYELAYKGCGVDLLFLKLKHQEYKKELDEPLTGLTQDVRSFKEMKEELISLLKLQTSFFC